MSRAERLARIQRQLQELRAGVTRLEAEGFGLKQKIEAIEVEFAALGREKDGGLG
jgi:hypothetical protein